MDASLGDAVWNNKELGTRQQRPESNGVGGEVMALGAWFVLGESDMADGRGLEKLERKFW